MLCFIRYQTRQNTYLFNEMLDALLFCNAKIKIPGKGQMQINTNSKFTWIHMLCYKAKLLLKATFSIIIFTYLK